jgi:hypothetical protein
MQNDKAVSDELQIGAGRFQMEASLLHAGRKTHLKIILVSLITAVVVVVVGANARVDSIPATVDNGVIKAGQPTAYAGNEKAAVR